MSDRHGCPEDLSARSSRSLRKRLGQISVLVVFSLVPMFTLLAFTINIGMMVNSKIALQNAVDLAAYAGAATQARLMTNISYVNYYMRMAYKKFIFKYYVLGNISQLCFPKQPDGGNVDGRCSGATARGSTAYAWINPSQGGGSSSFPNVPAVCISLSSASNPCQLASTVHVVAKPPCNPQDPACGSLQAAATQIGKYQLDACDNSSVINQKILGLWLYSTDYDTNDAGVTQLQGLVNGNDLGLLTEQQLSIERIRNLKNVLNAPPQKGVTVARAQSLAQNGLGGDTTKTERTVLAFQTIQNGLNPTVFDQESITMDELLPTTEQLRLFELKIKDLKAALAVMSPDTTDPNNPKCAMKIVTFGADPFVGVSKAPTSLVYYAVKATAKAKLLFNPFPIGHPADSIEFTAYAAAMPFGSRIGPDLSDPAKLEAEFVNPDGVGIEGDGSKISPLRYPRVRLDNNGYTTESAEFLGKVYGAMQTVSNGAVGQGQVGKDNMDLLLHLAILPSISELGRYNIPVDAEQYSNDTGPHYFQSYFATPGGSPNGVGFTFWAPFIGINAFDQFSDDMKALIEKITDLASQAGATTGALNQGATAIQTQAQQGLGNLQKSLNNPDPSISREGANAFRMIDPLSTGFWKTGNPPEIPGLVGSSDPKIIGPKLATSWVTDKDSHFFKAGRSGYSVKLVSFRTLMANPGTLTNDSGSTAWPKVNGDFQSSQNDIQTLNH